MLTIFSNRVYKSTLSVVDVFAIGQEILDFNSAKHHLVNKITTRERTGTEFLRDGQSLHMYTKGTFGYNDYFANSIINAANAALDSRRELHQLNIRSLKNQITTKKKNSRNSAVTWMVSWPCWLPVYGYPKRPSKPIPGRKTLS